LLLGTTKAIRTSNKEEWNYSRAVNEDEQDFPWKDNGFFRNNNAELDEHVKAYSNATKGVCFGKPCDDTGVMLSAEQPYGDAEKDRDALAGYPKVRPSGIVKDQVHLFIDDKTGRTL
jgi:hypothetical protein